MTHSFAKLTYHLIWSTKNREPLINSEIKHRLYGYFRTSITDKNQKLLAINGMPDHVHLLVGLSASIPLSDLIRDLKIYSTKWMKSAPMNIANFAWQEGFAAYTVGYSTIPAVTKYIENQEEHHKQCSYETEFLNLLKMQDIRFDPRFVLG